MKEKRKLFYISTIGLYLFAVFGQWVCGLAYDNQRCLQQREMRLRMLAVIAVCVLCVRLLRGDGRSKRVWRPILGAALSVCMLAAMVYPLLQACNTRDSFAVHPRLIEREAGLAGRGEKALEAVPLGRPWRGLVSVGRRTSRSLRISI